MFFLVPFLFKKVIHFSFSCVFFFLRRVDLTVLLIVGASFTSCTSPQRTHDLLLSDASGCIKALEARRNYEVGLSRKYILNIQNSSFFFSSSKRLLFFVFFFAFFCLIKDIKRVPFVFIFYLSAPYPRVLHARKWIFLFSLFF